VHAAGLLDDPRQRDTASAVLANTAERLLTAGASPDLSAAARDLLAARQALLAGRVDDGRAKLAHAAAPLVARAQRGRIDGATSARDAARLAGAVTAAAGARRQ
jgi:hypothetical protein